MRISFVLPPDGLTGGLRVISIYAKRLAQRGHDVVVIHPRETPASLREVWRSLRHHHRFPQTRYRGPTYFTMEGPLRKGSFRQIKLTHPAPVTAADVPDGDVVVATWWETAKWVWDLPASKGTKAHFVQGYEIWNETSAEGVERVNEIYRLPMPKMVIAEWLRELLRTKFGQEPLAVISNAVDPSQFFAPPRGKQAAPTVGFLYSIIPLKGTALAIEAVKRARAKLGELQVVSFGSEETKRELPLPEGTKFLRMPPPEQLRGQYTACDAWLFSSRDEGFGLPILEAMACRTPVIGTRAGAAPELIRGGGGKLLSAGDPEEMANAIVEIARMPEEEWRKMSDRAHQTATSYTWDDAAEMFEGCLEQAVRMAKRGDSWRAKGEQAEREAAMETR